VTVSYAVAVILLVILAVIRVGNLSPALAGWAGILIMLLGLGVRAWSMCVLGVSYSRILKVSGTSQLLGIRSANLEAHSFSLLSTRYRWSRTIPLYQASRLLREPSGLDKAKALGFDLLEIPIEGAQDVD